MTNCYTETETYTVADVKNVFEQIAADLAMIVRSTGAWDDARLDGTIEDVFAFAERGYIARLDIILRSATGQTLRAHRYDSTKSAGGWVNESPKGNIWPRVVGASLHVVLTESSEWTALASIQADRFRKSLNYEWSQSFIDLSYARLAPGDAIRYASRSFGVERRSFEIRL